MTRLTDVHGVYVVVASDELRSDEERRAAARWLERHHAACPRCGHDLHGAADGRCGECGLAVVMARRGWAGLEREFRHAVVVAALVTVVHPVVGLRLLAQAPLPGVLAIAAGGMPVLLALGLRPVSRWLGGQSQAVIRACAGLAALMAMLACVLPFAMLMAFAMRRSWIVFALVGLGAVVGLLVVRPPASRKVMALRLGFVVWVVGFTVWLRLGLGLLT